MKKINSALVITVFGFGLMASFFPVTNAFAGDETRLRLECRAFGPGDTKVDARYGKRGTLRDFLPDLKSLHEGCLRPGMCWMSRSTVYL